MTDVGALMAGMGFDWTGFDTPSSWLVCFHRGARTGWVRWIPGRFKHVSVIGYCSASRTWVGIDPAIDRMRIWVWRDKAKMDREMGEWMADARVVLMPAAGGDVSFRPGMWCVPVVAHLLGIRSGALRPDGLLRDCLRHGGRIVGEEAPDHVVQDPEIRGAG